MKRTVHYIRKLFVLYNRYIRAIQIDNNPDLEEVVIGHYMTWWTDETTIYSKDMYIEIRGCPSLKSIKVENAEIYYKIEIMSIILKVI